jgi:hypothetical protein
MYLHLPNITDIMHVQEAEFYLLNCRARKTRFSVPLEVFQGAHCSGRFTHDLQPSVCIRLYIKIVQATSRGHTKSRELTWSQNKTRRNQTYKESSILSGTCAAIWLKTNFGSSGHHHPRKSPLPHVCTVPSASAFF